LGDVYVNQQNQENGVYGVTSEAKEANLSKYVSIQSGWLTFTSIIAGKYSPISNQSTAKEGILDFTDRTARRQGALIDMAVIDPGKDPYAFLDAYDRANNAFK